MLNGCNDYVYISLYLAFEANISITRLIDENRGFVSRETVIRNIWKFFKSDAGNEGIFWWELLNLSKESFDQIQIISLFLGKRSLAMRYSTKQACIDLRKTVQFKFVAVACCFS
jgi:hypothetical protein